MNFREDNQEKKAIITQLKRIEGQIRGIQKLVAEDTYCLDVMNQIDAAKSSLNTVNKRLVNDHLNSCVLDAAGSGDFKNKIEEIQEIVNRISK
ncbi:MAG: metal-sensitive transcriptional regulator [Micrococcaceae bacterium]